MDIETEKKDGEETVSCGSSEELPKSKNKKQNNLGADAVLLTVSKVAPSAIAMVITMLLSRFRTKTEYGTYSQILMVINLATALLMLGLPKSLNYFLARADTDEEKQKFLSFYYTFNTILSFILGAVLVASVGLIERYFDNPAIRGFLYFLAVFPWSKIVCSSVENLLIVYHKTKILVGFRILNSLVLLLSVLVVQWMGWTFNEYMVLYVVTESLFAAAVYIIAYRISGGIKPYFSLSMTKTVLAFSIPLGLASVVGTLNTELDKLIIGNFMSTEKYAVYSNAARELPIAIIASAFTAVLLPQFARLIKHDKTKEAVDLWGKTITLTYIIISFIVIGCFTFAPEAIKVLYSEKYLEGITVFRIYTLLLLLRVTYFGIILNSQGKTKFIFWCSLISLGINVVFNYSFYFIFRLFGQEFISPAVATVISTIIMAVFQLIVTCKSAKIPFSKIQPWGNIFKITVVNVVFAVLFYLLKIVLPIDTFVGNMFSGKFSGGDVVEALILAAVWGAVYFAIMFRPMKKLWKGLKTTD